MNNTIRINKFNKLGGSRKLKGSGPKGKKRLKAQSTKVPPRKVATPIPNLEMAQQQFFPEEMPIEESISEVPDASRSISVTNISLPPNDQKNELENLLKGDYSFKCPKKDGTPGKRLLYLKKACEELIITYDKSSSYLTKNKDSLTILESILNSSKKGANEEEGQMDIEEDEESSKKTSRSWWTSTSPQHQTAKDALNGLVLYVLDDILSKNNKGKNKVKDKATEATIIASLWSIILVKSISDISQMGQLINYIINSNEEQLETKTGTIYDNINKDVKAGFVSSDKICAGVSSILIRNVPFLTQTLCTRKSSVGHKTTQNIIVLKGEIAALIVCLNIFNIFNTTKNKNILFNMFPSETTLNTDFKYMMANIAYYYDEYVSKLDNIDLNLNNVIEKEFYELFYIKRDINNPSIYEKDRFKNLSNFIKGIYSVLNSSTHSNTDKKNLYLLTLITDNYFNENNKNKKSIQCKKWTYYVATDVFRLLYPQSNYKFDQNKIDLLSDISYGEILAATVDGTYGHDFAGLDCIKKLGEDFMEICGSYTGNDEAIKEKARQYKNLLIPEEGKKNEDEAIKICLKNNKCVTIDQLQDDLLVNFDYNTNYLANKTSIGNPQYWHLFDSLFSLKPLILAIDFTVGLQPYSYIASSQVEKTVLAKDSQEYINPIDPNQLQYIVTQKIKENGKGFELMGVNALFDGAASYLIYPKYVVDSNGKFFPYISETILNYQYEEGQGTNKMVSITELKFKIETSSDLDYRGLEDKYKSSLIPSTFTPMDGIIDALLKEYNGKKDDLNKALETLDDKNNDFSVRFSKLWAELLNYKLNDKKINEDKELKIKLDKTELASFKRGCLAYLKNLKNQGPLPTNLYKIKNIIEDSNPSKLDNYLSLFNQIMALIIKNLVDPIINDEENPKIDNEEKNKILLMLANGILFAKNNTKVKRAIFGIEDESQDISNIENEIDKTSEDKIDNVLNYFLNNRNISSEKLLQRQPIATKFQELGTPKGEVLEKSFTVARTEGRGSSKGSSKGSSNINQVTTTPLNFNRLVKGQDVSRPPFTQNIFSSHLKNVPQTPIGHFEYNPYPPISGSPEQATQTSPEKMSPGKPPTGGKMTRRSKMTRRRKMTRGNKITRRKV